MSKLPGQGHYLSIRQGPFSGVGFSKGGHHVRGDRARLGELAGGEIKGGYLSPRQDALVE